MSKHAIADGLVTVFAGSPLITSAVRHGGLCWDVPGIGKSESLKKLAKRQGMKVKELKLRKMRKRDVVGLPEIDDAFDGVVKHMPLYMD